MTACAISQSIPLIGAHSCPLPLFFTAAPEGVPPPVFWGIAAQDTGLGRGGVKGGEGRKGEPKGGGGEGEEGEAENEKIWQAPVASAGTGAGVSSSASDRGKEGGRGGEGGWVGSNVAGSKGGVTAAGCAINANRCHAASLPAVVEIEGAVQFYGNVIDGGEREKGLGGRGAPQRKLPPPRSAQGVCACVCVCVCVCMCVCIYFRGGVCVGKFVWVNSCG